MKVSYILKILFLFLSLNVLFALSNVSNNENAFTIHMETFKPSYTIGDNITLRITITHSKKDNITFPTPNDFMVQPFNLLSYKINSPIIKKKEVKQIIELHLSIYKVGQFFIPPIKIIQTNSNNEKIIVKTLPYAITITPLLKDEKKNIKPISSIITSYFAWILLLYLCIIIMTFILVYRIIKMILKRRKKIIPIPLQILTQLNSLEKKQYLQNKNYKSFFYYFSYLIKLYLEKIHHVRFTAMTTSEIKKILQTKKINHRKIIVNILEYADQVKFLSSYTPSYEECMGLFNQFKTIVHTNAKQVKK